MKKKQPVYKGLDKTSVLYNDQSEYSPEIFDITDYPKRLTAGKNILRFRGNLTNLAQNSPLDIEIIDYNGEPIYHEITTYIAEDKSRVVSIYIYPDTSPGPATITLLTEVQSINGQSVPSNWKNVYNAKWSRTVYVNPTLVNESEIIFETLPNIGIEEQVGVQLDRTYSVSQFPTYNSGSVKYVSRNGAPVLIISGGAFSSSMQGGTVTVNTPNDLYPIPTYTFNTVPYTTTVKKVLNTSSLLLDSEYTIATTTSIVPHTYTDFGFSSYNLEYEQTPNYIETENSESYAIIKINNLEPLTGDISRIKTFINNSGTVGTWEQISDIELDETEIFVTNTASITPDIPIGTIYNQTTINTYYTSSVYTNNSLIGTASLTYNNSVLSNSMRISGSGDVIITQIKNQYAGSFIKDAEYKIVLDAVGQKVLTNASMSIYLSGSAFNLDVTDKYNNQFPKQLGKKIGQLYLNGSEQTKRYDDITFSFKADKTGDGVLLFVLESGQWYISDIRTTSDNDAGYTPNYTRIRALVPTSHKSGVQLNFKIEYYNAAGVKSKQTNYVNNVNWNGGNRYIDGEYSMLTGSLYVADSLNSGIAISGYSNSGFVRSLGYNGFAAAQPGFLLWSGSAMSGSAGTKGGVPYTGVGLEMYANSNNYFRYSTANSELDIRTNSFFLGSNSSSFISGSNGKIQISSSNFIVDATGAVTASAALLRDATQSDIFIHRIRDAYTSSFIAAGQTSAGTSTYEYSSRPYLSINLTGSRGLAAPVDGPGPASFIRIGDEDHVVGRICIHPADFYDTNKYQQFGSTVILEAGVQFYLSVGDYSGVGYPYDDSGIAANPTDFIYPAIQTYTINNAFTGNVSMAYDNLIKVEPGTQILLGQSKFAWRIIAMSNYNNCKVIFAGGLKTSILNTTDVIGTGTIFAPTVGGTNITGTNITATTKLSATAITGSAIKLTGLPTTLPIGPGYVWNDSGTLRIS